MNKYIYVIKNNITNEKYIGIRRCECDVFLDRYKGENTILARELKKYGKKNFTKMVMAIIPSEKLEEDLYNIYLNSGNYIELTEIDSLKEIKTRDNKGGKNGVARKVICLNTEEVFDTIAEASKKYSINKTSIIQACNPKYNVAFAGKNKNGEKLKWDYYDAYLAKLNGEEYVYDTSKMTPKNIKTKPVRCKETGEEFNSLKEAAEKYKIAIGSISNSCTSTNTGTFIEDTLELLHWEYVNPKDNKYYDKKYADRF